MITAHRWLPCMYVAIPIQQDALVTWSTRSAPYVLIRYADTRYDKRCLSESSSRITSLCVDRIFDTLKPWDLIIIGSGNGLSFVDTEPPPKPLSNYHQLNASLCHLFEIQTFLFKELYFNLVAAKKTMSFRSVAYTLTLTSQQRSFYMFLSVVGHMVSCSIMRCVPWWWLCLETQ